MSSFSHIRSVAADGTEWLENVSTLGKNCFEESFQVAGTSFSHVNQ
jgi:hypothetical protein